MAPTTRGKKIDFSKVFDNKLPAELKLKRIVTKPKRLLSSEDYLVRSIIGRRESKKNGIEYLVSWKQFPSQATWEPEDVIRETCSLLIEDFLRETPTLQPPSPDLIAFSLSNLGIALFSSLRKEDDETLKIAFPGAVFRYVFNDLEVHDGWHALTEAKLQSLLNQPLELRYKKTPGEGRVLEFPIKIKPAIKSCKPCFGELIIINLRKNSKAFE